MRRPILVAVIGYMFGIIWGLYFNFSIVLLYIPIIAIHLVFIILKQYNKSNKNLNQNFKSRKFKLLSTKRYIRYLKIILNPKVIFLITLLSVISNTVVIFKNNKYQKIYESLDKVSFEVIIVSEKQEKQYKDVYKVKVKKIGGFRNIYFYLSVNKKEKIDLKYGDFIEVQGQYIKPSGQRNYKGFDYGKYLKTINIYGTVKVEKIKKIAENRANPILTYSKQISSELKERAKMIMPEEVSSMFIGLMLGDTTYIQENIQESFKISNLSHVLSISGMHISYIISGIVMVLQNGIGKRRIKIITIFILIIYMFITGFSASILRAGIMGILFVTSGLIHRKNDVWISISLAMFITLIYNPFLIINMGLQFSYIATIGIIVFNKSVFKILKGIKIRNRKFKYRLNKKFVTFIDKIKELMSVTISAQILILPVMIYYLNTLGVYFLLTNLLMSFIIEPIIVLGFILIIILLINLSLAKIISFFFTIGIYILIHILKLGSDLPFSKIYLPSISVATIIFYYIVIFISNFLYHIYFDKNLNFSQMRVKDLIELGRYKYKENRKRVIKTLILVSILFVIILNLIPKNLNIYFIDVGQGDSCLIVTPRGKKVLIDGGGNRDLEGFDVGESVLVPYLLDRGIKTLDYIIISHFDSDHVNRNETLIRKPKSGYRNFFKTNRRFRRI